MKYVCLVFTFLVVLPLVAQKKNDNYRLHIKRASGPINIDGVGDDTAWQDAEEANDFFMVLPMDNRKATEPSTIKMAYDDKHIYLLATFYNATKANYFVESLRRDFSFGKNDNFLLFLDPFNNQTTGFSFGSNAYGAQWDGTMFDGSRIDLNWDSKWISEVTRDEESWVFEMAIPFKSIRYGEGIKEWGINFSRLDLKSSEKSSWTPIPRQFPTASLAYSGTLVWDEAPPAPGVNFSIIPYVLGDIKQNLESNDAIVTNGKVGGDFKFSLTSSLNLDLTINPDFSQVEVDRQITNLDRFELFFPERRQFFLENGDLFANFGYESIRPFFSRRIGLNVPIQAGARVSGNLNDNWRLGLMDMQTSSIEETGLPSQNFAVLSLQRKVFDRSNIGLMFVNKQSFNYPSENDSINAQYARYNRNLGIEYNLASANNAYNGKLFILKSFAPNAGDQGFAQGANLDYRSRKWNWRIKEEWVSDDYSAEVGFVRRRGYRNLTGNVGHLFFPKGGPVLSHGPQLTGIYFFDDNFKQTDHTTFMEYLIDFRTRSTLTFFVSDDYVELLDPFDPSGLQIAQLPTGSKNNWNAFGWDYASKPQSLFTYAFGGRVGGYYADGNRTSLRGEAGYRFQPYVSLKANFNYNHIELPQPWNTNDFWLLGAEADITFTNKLFFANLLQYNEQSNNFNINSRFQWRYSPASDLFIVYTNNYVIAPFEGKNWGLTLKFTYWLNN